MELSANALAGAVLDCLAAGPRQIDRLIHLHTPLGSDVLVAETVDGIESLDHGGFRFEVSALSLSAHLDLAGLIGQPVLLQLQTADGLEARRPFHGHVTTAERVGSNGGLARYRVVVEPWLAFLRDRVDAFVFQDMTVVEIVESVFADYVGQGKLAPAWRWDLADPSVYRKRSLCTQFDESDFAFVARLLAEEGIHYHFEHSGDPGSDSLGAHTLVLADHNDAFADIGPVRFHRSDVTECADSVQRFSHSAVWRPRQLRRASWDYRTLATRAVEAGPGDTPSVTTDDDILPPYAYPDRETGERLVRRRHEALAVATGLRHGTGSWRQLRPGACFELTQHPQGGRFLCLHARHRARNNFGAEVLEQIEQQLGRADLPDLPLPFALDAQMTEPLSRSRGDDARLSRHWRECDGAPAPLARAGTRSGGWGEGSRDSDAGPIPTTAGGHFYDNHFSAIAEDRPYRPPYEHDIGQPLHPRPVVRGTQSAIVVTDGAPVQTDRDHRIKVQFPWQRGSNAGSRQSHPSGEDNAPGDGRSWTWVRVSTAWAGDNWGSVFVPRRGQEVLVAFLEGDIDRPVVVGSLYNGRGNPDATHNQVTGGPAGATGNAASWFDGNEHKAVFTGFKTQALSTSTTGTGGYQQLRLDDTPGQGRVQASTTQKATTLTLGHLKGGKDNVREGERGFGIELSTQASGALRAGTGLLLSTEAGRHQLDAASAQAQLARSGQLLDSLQEASRAQSAELPREAAPLPARKAHTMLVEHLAGTASRATPGGGIEGGDGESPAWTAPALVASSPAGIAALTPADQVWVSGTQTLLCADQDLQCLSQDQTVIAVEQGIALYTHGSEPPAGEPNTESGIALHAAQGAVSARAATGKAELAAQIGVTLASTTADVHLGAPNKHLLATAAGAYIRLEGDNIELGAPGTIEFKGAKKEWSTPQSVSGQAPALAKGKLALCEFKARGADAAGDGVVVLGA